MEFLRLLLLHTYKFMSKKIILLIVIIVSAALVMFSVPKKWLSQQVTKVIKPPKPFAEATIQSENVAISVIKKRATLLKSYLKKNGYSDSICFIINFAIPSGKPRFFIFDLKNDSILQSGLVTHGSGSQTTTGKFVFKNIPNSLASSKGKYKIGAPYFGKFGLAYKLYGQDSTNNKAFERFVVLHSHECVPEKPVYPQQICVSWGCPTVSPRFLQKLQVILTKTSKPILLDMQFDKN
jgi:L,D-transpeptidase catalytic domain